MKIHFFKIPNLNNLKIKHIKIKLIEWFCFKDFKNFNCLLMAINFNHFKYFKINILFYTTYNTEILVIIKFLIKNKTFLNCMFSLPFKDRNNEVGIKKIFVDVIVSFDWLVITSMVR